MSKNHLEPSTSTLPVPTQKEELDGEVGVSSASGKAKKRKLPSCDSCKLRRVLCIPQPPPASCPRCKEKGIVCTTTPVIRRKPTGRTGKRIEEARATFGIADPNAPHLTLPSNSPWIPSRLQPRIAARPSPSTPHISSHDLDARLGLAELSGELASHLIDLYQHVPQSWLPLCPRGRVAQQFEAAGRRLDGLPPQYEVLTHTIMALTSRLSSHPFIVGQGPLAPAFESLTPSYLASHKDLRVYGQRREEVCAKMREKAVRLAWERGTLVESSEESMACCHLLEMLEGRNNPKAGKPYGSAFVSHLRTLIDESDEGGAPQIMNMPLGWSALIMREALFAANAGRTSAFAPADDLLLCGPVPPSIEEALLETVDDVDVRDSVTLFFRPMRPYTYHVARLARECSDRVSGTHSRKQPLDERFVSKFLTQLDHLFHLLSILDGRISFVLSAAASVAHALPGEFESQRQYIMRACIYTLQLAWSSLSLPIYTDLKRRIEALKSGTPSSMAERRRTRERLEVLLQQIYRSTIKGARMVASCVHGAPSLAFLTHLHQEKLESWIEILLDARPVEEGGEGITYAEKMSDLKWMEDGLKTMGWSWSDDGQLLESLESGIEQLQLNAPAATSPPSPPSSSSTSPAPLPHFDMSSLPASGTGMDFAAYFASGAGAGAAGMMGSGAGGAFDLDALLSVPLFGSSLADLDQMGQDFMATMMMQNGAGAVPPSRPPPAAGGEEDAWMTPGGGL